MPPLPFAMPETIHRRATLHELGYANHKFLSKTIHLVARHQKKPVKQKTTAKQKEATTKHCKVKEKINAAVDAALNVVWEQAIALHAELKVLTAKKFYERLLQRGGTKLASRRISWWNAFLRKRLKEAAAGTSEQVVSY